MKKLPLPATFLLLSVFFLPLALTQIEAAFSTATNKPSDEFNYLKIWSDTTENQSLYKKITASWSETMRIFDQVNNYYTNSYAFKTTLFNIYRDFKLGILHKSPWPDKVILGNDDWMFLGNGFANVIKETRRVDTFNLRQLSFIKNNFRNFETFRRKEGFSFFLAIAPDKPSVYGDYLPILKSDRPGKLDQVKAIMTDLGITVIDLNENRKNSLPIRRFHKTDTHWNSYGAFLGYQRLIATIKTKYNDVPVHRLDEFTFDSAVWDQGDLSRMMTIKKPENWIKMTPIYQVNRERLPDQFKVPDQFVGVTDDYEIRLHNPDRKYSVLIFRDSFFSNMSDFFANDFRKEL